MYNKQPLITITTMKNKLKGPIAEELKKVGHYIVNKGDNTLLIYWCDDIKNSHYRAQIYNRITDEILSEKKVKKTKHLGEAIMDLIFVN